MAWPLRCIANVTSFIDFYVELHCERARGDVVRSFGEGLTTFLAGD